MIKRDDGVFEALYRKYYGRAYRFFRKSGVSDDEAHDLAQSTFTRIYKTFAQYRAEAEWSYIETSARNQLFNWIRSRKTAKRYGELSDISDELKTAAPPDPDLAEMQQTLNRRARLWTAIAELPEGQRQSIELWLTEMKYEAIARTLGATVDAVKSRLRDAKRALRAKLGESLPEDEE
jgi:RNA polymerase sigma-70 factor (ECF subfamily)